MLRRQSPPKLEKQVSFCIQTAIRIYLQGANPSELEQQLDKMRKGKLIKPRHKPAYYVISYLESYRNLLSTNSLNFT